MSLHTERQHTIASRRRAWYFTTACLMVLGLAAAVALMLGSYGVTPTVLLQALQQDDGSNTAFVIRELRLPRLLVGIFAGAALGLSGAIAQTITRNPLGEPGLLGVTSGAALAMALCMTYVSLSTPFQLLLATAGGMSAAILTLAISLGSRLDPLYLTLTGMSVNLFCIAAITVLLVSVNAEGNGIYYWLTGSLLNRTWEHVHLAWACILPGLLLSMVFAGKLDLLMLDEDVLASLGTSATPWRILFGGIAVLLAAATVAAAGPLTFVGLMAPHIVRFGLGHRHMHHRHLLPLSALTGAVLVSTADILAKCQEIPVGILCVLIGGPMLIHLVNKQGNQDA